MSEELFPLQPSSIDNPGYKAMSKFRRIKRENGQNMLLRYRMSEQGYTIQELYTTERELQMLERYGIETLPRQPLIFGSTTAPRIGYIVPEVKINDLTELDINGHPRHIATEERLIQVDQLISKLLLYVDDSLRDNPSKEILYDLGLHQFALIENRIKLIDIDPLIVKSLDDIAAFYSSIYRQSIPYLLSAKDAMDTPLELESEQLLRQTSCIMATPRRNQIVSRWIPTETIEELKADGIEILDWGDL